MTTSPYERAVIEAARAMRREVFETGEEPSSQATIAMWSAIDALAAHEASLAAAGVKYVGWHEVAEGDELRGNNGRFYPVVRTLKLRRGQYEIVVQLPTGPRVLTRPTEADPAAVVRRGATGEAVDTLVHVFSSNAGRH